MDTTLPYCYELHRCAGQHLWLLRMICYRSRICTAYSGVWFLNGWSGQIENYSICHNRRTWMGSLLLQLWCCSFHPHEPFARDASDLIFVEILFGKGGRSTEGSCVTAAYEIQLPALWWKPKKKFSFVKQWKLDNFYSMKITKICKIRYKTVVKKIQTFYLVAKLTREAFAHVVMEALNVGQEVVLLQEQLVADKALEGLAVVRCSEMQF